jgi:hypothetical protein
MPLLQILGTRQRSSFLSPTGTICGRVIPLGDLASAGLRGKDPSRWDRLGSSTRTTRGAFSWGPKTRPVMHDFDPGAILKLCKIARSENTRWISRAPPSSFAAIKESAAPGRARYTRAFFPRHFREHDSSLGPTG